MVNSRFHFYLRFLSVAIVVSNLLLSAPDIAEGQFLAAETPRCPATHPFAFGSGQNCCSEAEGSTYVNGELMSKWTSRRHAWDAFGCVGETELCSSSDKPCENFKVDCTSDDDCGAGYGKCVEGSCVTQCAEGEFQCEVSKICHDPWMKCNGVPDCKQWYDFTWEDNSDESGCDAAA